MTESQRNLCGNHGIVKNNDLLLATPEVQCGQTQTELGGEEEAEDSCP